MKNLARVGLGSFQRVKEYDALHSIVNLWYSNSQHGIFYYSIGSRISQGAIDLYNIYEGNAM